MGYANGDVIQITDEKHAWFPALLIVSEVKTWGVVAYCIVPTSNDGNEQPTQAYNRLEFGTFEKVGAAVFTQTE